MAWTTKSRLSQLLVQSIESRIDGGDVLDVAGQDEIGAERLRQRRHALAERLALIGEGEFRAVLAQGLGDAPGNGMVVGDAHDEAALSLHQTVHSETSPCARSFFCLTAFAGRDADDPPNMRSRRHIKQRDAMSFQTL